MKKTILNCAIRMQMIASRDEDCETIATMLQNAESASAFYEFAVTMEIMSNYDRSDILSDLAEIIAENRSGLRAEPKNWYCDFLDFSAIPDELFPLIQIEPVDEMPDNIRCHMGAKLGIDDTYYCRTNGKLVRVDFSRDAFK